MEILIERVLIRMNHILGVIKTDNLIEIPRFLFTGDTNLIIVLLILMIIDIITGVLKAIHHKELWSRKSLYGFTRKLLVFLMIIVANLIDYVLDLNGVLLLATVLFYITNEILSIIENAGQLGLPIPNKIMDTLEVINKREKIEDKLLKSEEPTTKRRVK